jgi:diacylglycerol kinase (ATP)
MKKVKLLHNPAAGDQEYSGKDLVKVIEKHGYECRYANTKEEGWDEIEEDTDIIAVAGGDGTVRKACKAVLKQKLYEKRRPIAVLPAGTANNIGTSLKLRRPAKDLIAAWDKAEIHHLDIGTVKGHDDASFFLEGLGFGVFPNLINAMKKREEEAGSAEEEIKVALRTLLEIVQEYDARECRLMIDGMDHSGKFLMVEVMNMPYIGPNLNLNPIADPTDGELEIIIIPEDQREKLANYVQQKLDGEEVAFSFSSLKGKDIQIAWEGKHAHIDDSIMKAKERFELVIDVNKGVLQFLIPQAEEKEAG